jgi:hypothetical protein
MVTKPAVKMAETPKVVYDGEIDQPMDYSVTEFVYDDEEFNRYIEEQNSRIAALSSNVNEILSNIDSIIEKNKADQEVLSG